MPGVADSGKAVARNGRGCIPCNSSVRRAFAKLGKLALYVTPIAVVDDAAARNGLRYVSEASSVPMARILKAGNHL